MKRFLFLVVCISLVLGMLSQTAFAALDPKLLSQPYELTITQMVADDDKPYGGVALHFKIDQMPPMLDDEDGQGYWLDFERKIGDNGVWQTFGSNPIDMFGEEYGYEPPNKYEATDTWADDYSDTTVSYRARMIIFDTVSIIASTPWSNVASIGIKASSWATGDLTKAMQYGLVPSSISGDFTQPITREEFAELAARLYEVYTEKKAVPAPDSTFTDCNNQEVLKAYQLGIVAGVGNNKFAPKVLINREQIAAMLNRAVKVIAPGTDFSTAGAPTFNDEKSITSYFLENVKFMSKSGFIKGINGNFEPKSTCTREMAVIIAVRVYENYKN